MTDKKPRFSKDDIRELRRQILEEPLQFPSRFKSWVPEWAGLNSTITQSQTLNVVHQNYVPALTGAGGNPNLGVGGTIRGRWAKVGPDVHAIVTAQFAGASISGGTGAWSMSLPVSSNPDSGFHEVVLGTFTYFDNSSGNYLFGPVIAETPTTVTMVYPATWLGSRTSVGASAPWTPANFDVLRLSVLYESLVTT